MTPFAETLAKYLRAGYPAISVATFEEERLLRDLSELRAMEWTFASWSSARGWRDASGQPMQNMGGATTAQAILNIGQLRKKTVAVFFDLHTQFTLEPDSLRAVRDALELAKSGLRPMLLCSPFSTVPTELQKDVALLDYPLPTPAQLRDLIPELLQAIKSAASKRGANARPVPTSLGEDVITSMVTAARGLTWNEAENAFSLAIMTAEPAQMASIVHREKTSLVRKQGLLELIEPRVTLADVGGLDPLKGWFLELGELIERAQAALAWGFLPEDLPKGVLLTGIPGTGKSLLAAAVAAQWGLPLLRLDMSLILDSRVGMSESQMRQALRLAEAMSPCLLHIDELDTAVAGAGSDSTGVTTRIVGQLLTWLQDRGVITDGLPSPVFVLATTNHPDRLPAALMRPGRFDGRWFVDLPTRPERRAVASIHLSKRRQQIDE